MGPPQIANNLPGKPESHAFLGDDPSTDASEDPGVVYMDTHGGRSGLPIARL